MRIRLQHLAVALVPAVALASCGGDGNDPTASPPSGNGSASTSPASTTSPTTDAPSGTAVLPGGTLVPTTLFPGGPTFGGGSGPPQGAPCRELPTKGKPLDWFPDDLPLPAGSFPVEDVAAPTGDTSGYRRGLLVVKGTIRQFVSFVLQRWPKEGWQVGRGESERGESENAFFRDEFTGAFRVRAPFCDDGFSELFVVYGRTPQPTARP